MIIDLFITDHGDGEHYASVRTDNGGDQDYGPFPSQTGAMDVLRQSVEDDFCEVFDQAKVRLLQLDPDDPD